MTLGGHKRQKRTLLYVWFYPIVLSNLLFFSNQILLLKINKKARFVLVHIIFFAWTMHLYFLDSFYHHFWNKNILDHLWSICVFLDFALNSKLLSRQPPACLNLFIVHMTFPWLRIAQIVSTFGKWIFITILSELLVKEFQSCSDDNRERI